MAGIPINKNILDQRVGFLAKQLRDTFEDIEKVKVYFDAVGSQGLLDLGYSQSEVDVMVSAFTDLDKLRRIANAQDTQTSNNDFFFWARRLVGLE